jgi:ABC-type polysaccharide/polyol phosphate transport system ATPase subunit
MVSHDMNIVRSFCTRVLWLRRGSIVADGPIETTLAKYEAVIQQETLTAERGGAAHPA